MNVDNPAPTPPPAVNRRSPRPLLLLVAVTAAVSIVIAIDYRQQSRRAEALPTPSPVSPRPLADEATVYLRDRKAEPLTGPLLTQLTDPAKKAIPTEQHALLNQPAPSFSLVGADDKAVSLDELLSRGPVVVVFYYGYSCDHCVAQLFAVNKDLRYFTELNASVVAISPDTPEHTRERYAEYGKFDFPVVCDKDRATASRYGVFRPAAGDLPKWQAHGTFVVGRDRSIRWVNTGTEPFTDTVTLLRELAASEGRLPAPRDAKGGTP